MSEEPSEWIDFSHAVREVEEELGLDQTEAGVLLSQAVAEGKIGAYRYDPHQYPAAPFDEAPKKLTPLPAKAQRMTPTEQAADKKAAAALERALLDHVQEVHPRTVRRLPASKELAARAPKPQRYEVEPNPAPMRRSEEIGRRTELWVHLRDENRWFKVNRSDLRRWFDEPAQQAVGKRPRIKSHLANLYPDGVPDPAFCPRKDLKADLLSRDKRLAPLDEATLKTAIDEYNSSIRNDPN